MHDAAYQWVADHAIEAKNVLDIGGRDINGTPRALFPFARYTVIDLQAGVNVNVIDDVTTWKTDETFDVVLCLEVLEHAKNWKRIIKAAHQLCSGLFIVTAAGPGREPHSAQDGGELREGEHYANIGEKALFRALVAAGFHGVMVQDKGADVRAIAYKEPFDETDVDRFVLDVPHGKLVVPAELPAENAADLKDRLEAEYGKSLIVEWTEGHWSNAIAAALRLAGGS